MFCLFTDAFKGSKERQFTDKQFHAEVCPLFIPWQIKQVKNPELEFVNFSLSPKRCHVSDRSLIAKKWDILQWLSESPDFNSTEHPLQLLKTKLKAERPTIKYQLMAAAGLAFGDAHGF